MLCAIKGSLILVYRVLGSKISLNLPEALVLCLVQGRALNEGRAPFKWHLITLDYVVPTPLVKGRKSFLLLSYDNFNFITRLSSLRFFYGLEFSSLSAILSLLLRENSYSKGTWRSCGTTTPTCGRDVSRSGIIVVPSSHGTGVPISYKSTKIRASPSLSLTKRLFNLLDDPRDEPRHDPRDATSLSLEQVELEPELDITMLEQS